MKYVPIKHKLVLAIDPSTRGFGFVIFEGPLRPIDWGVKEIRKKSSKSKNIQCLNKIEELIDFFQPDVVVVEDYLGITSRRCKRIQDLIEEIVKLANKSFIKTRRFPRSKIIEFFSQFGATTKYQIAQAIAIWLPEFKSRLPRFRKPWMSEDYRMNIFDAAALALTFYYFDNAEKD